MQRICCFILSLAFVIHGSAQFKKGTTMMIANIATGSFISGNTDYTYPSAAGYQSDNDNFNLSITPGIGKFTSDKFALGVSLYANTSYQKISNKTLSGITYSSSKITTTDLGLGVFGRYYFTSGQSLLPYTQLYVNGGTGFGKNNGFTYSTDGLGDYRDDYTGDTKNKFFLNSGLNLGITKMIRSNVGLDLYAGYAFSYTRQKTESTLFRNYTGTSPDYTQKFEPTQKFRGNGINFGLGLLIFLLK